ncbi:MAG TPA: Druantia anti-phage system protein DruA, partial [Chloroflexota bacterium]|nr:Druantia anti-phage system protein DruA [Chloroflexota bacterium]
MPDGRLKEASCYCALRAMENDALLTLPPPTSRGDGHTHPVTFSAASDRQAPITGARADLGPITLRPVTAKPEVALWRELVARWHYLGFRRHVGAQLRYLAWDAQDRLLAAMEFSAAAWKVAPRDRFLRWTPQQRAARLHLLVDQATFLTLLWVRVTFLASSLLGQVARQLPADWLARYGYSPLLMVLLTEQIANRLIAQIERTGSQARVR